MFNVVCVCVGPTAVPGVSGSTIGGQQDGGKGWPGTKVRKARSWLNFILLRCSQLNLFTKNFFPISDFNNLEFVMLSYFNWKLCLPTAHCTTSLLLPHSLHPTDLHNGGPLLSFSKAATYLEEYIQHFLRISLLDTAFMNSR